MGDLMRDEMPGCFPVKPPTVSPEVLRHTLEAAPTFPPGRGPNYFSAEWPVALNQPPGVEPSGLPNQPDGSVDVSADAPYSAVPISDARIEGPLLAQSPIYQPPQPPIDGDELQGDSFVGRLQPPIGFSGGSYALNSEYDAGSPTDMPDEALPGLRDGAYRYSWRLRSIGDQGVMDNLLRHGGSYLEVNQPPYMGDDRPAGR
jgi:hypothetical protein